MRDIIRSTPFVDDIADCMFPNIQLVSSREPDPFDSSAGNMDATPLSVFRAVFGSVLTDDQSITVIERQLVGSAASLKDPGFLEHKDAVYFVDVEDGLMDEAAGEMRTAWPDFKEQQDIHAFLVNNAKMDVRIYLNEANRSTAVLGVTLWRNGRGFRVLHTVLSLLPRLCPWYFRGNNLRSDQNIKNLLRVLAGHSDEPFDKVLLPFQRKYNFRDAAIRTQLTGIGKKVSQAQIAAAQSDISSLEESIARANREYHELCRRHNDMNIRLLGLQTKAETMMDNDIADFFVTNKALSLSNVTPDGNISFRVMTHLDIFDAELYESWRGICREYFTDTVGPWPAEDADALCDAIFSDDPQIKVRMYGSYIIDLGGYVSVGDDWRDADDNGDYYLPNPHLRHHSCMGEYVRQVDEAIRRGDIIGAVTLCIASAKNVNIGESATFPHLLRDIAASNKDIIELPDGTACTPREAVSWLRTGVNPKTGEITETEKGE